MNLFIINNQYCFITIAPNISTAKSKYDLAVSKGEDGGLIDAQKGLRNARKSASIKGIKTGALTADAAVNAYKDLSNFNRGIADNSISTSYNALSKPWNAKSTTDLINQWGNMTFGLHVTRREMLGSKGSAFLKGFGHSLNGAALGFSSSGSWIGAVIGGVAGSLGALAGRVKAKKKATLLARLTNAFSDYARDAAYAGMRLNSGNIQDNMIRLFRLNFAANGGSLYGGIGNVADYTFANEYLAAKLKKDLQDLLDNNAGLYDMLSPNYNLINQAALGGLLSTQGGTYSTGLSKVDVDNRHEDNPYNGVPMGFDNEGTPNFVEGGESIYEDYVFSDRLKVPKIPKSHLNNPKRMSYEEKVLKPYLGMTFSEAAKKVEKQIYGETLGAEGKEIQYTDLEDKADTLKAVLAVLAETLELLKQEEQMKELQKAIADMSPEELAALQLQMMAMLQLEAQLLQMAELLAMQLLLMTPEELAMMQQLQQLISPEEMEAMLQLWAVLQSEMSPEEIAALLQQEAMQLLGYAYGGNLFNKGGFLRTKSGRLEYTNEGKIIINGNTYDRNAPEVLKFLKEVGLTNSDEDLEKDFNAINKKYAKEQVEKAYKEMGLKPKAFFKSGNDYFNLDVDRYINEGEAWLNNSNLKKFESEGKGSLRKVENIRNAYNAWATKKGKSDLDTQRSISLKSDFINQFSETALKNLAKSLDPKANVDNFDQVRKDLIDRYSYKDLSDKIKKLVTYNTIDEEIARNNWKTNSEDLNPYWDDLNKTLNINDETSTENGKVRPWSAETFKSVVPNYDGNITNLENSNDYKEWTDYVKSNLSDQNIINYLTSLDQKYREANNNRGIFTDKNGDLLPEEKLKSIWYNVRNDQNLGRSHYTPTKLLEALRKKQLTLNKIGEDFVDDVTYNKLLLSGLFGDPVTEVNNNDPNNIITTRSLVFPLYKEVPDPIKATDLDVNGTVELKDIYADVPTGNSMLGNGLQMFSDIATTAAGMMSKPGYENANRIINYGLNHPTITPSTIPYGEMLKKQDPFLASIGIKNAFINALEANRNAGFSNASSRTAANLAAYKNYTDLLGLSSMQTAKYNNDIVAANNAMRYLTDMANALLRKDADTYNLLAWLAGITPIVQGSQMRENIDLAYAETLNSQFNNARDRIYAYNKDDLAARQTAWYLKHKV